MNSLVLPCRYAVFAAFVICNAITCSVAVWNLSLAQSGGQTMNVDSFVIFVGSLGLIFIFTMIILELSLKNSISGHVWVESAWVGLFFVLEFCASIALSALGPGVMCSTQMMEVDNASCSSTRVLLVFSWICTLLLFGYLLLLTISAYMHQKENPRVWHCSVRRFFNGDSRTYLADSISPSLPNFLKKSPPSFAAPQPRRPPIHTIQAIRSTPSPDSVLEKATERPIPPIPAALPHHQLQNTREATATSFYPQHVQLSQPAVAPVMKQLPSHGVSPPPLGDWPRADIISQPSRSKRDGPRPLILTTSAIATTSANSSPNSRTSPSSATPRSARSSGPRTGRSGPSNGARPPPLDLSKISSHSRPSTARSR
jgi:hypothetical protein